MKILSLFDGISCARVALDRAGIPVEAYYASEVDKYAMQISAKNYPDIVQVGDIKDLVATTEPFDLLIGGSPCQDLSIAKKNRKGLDGERSGLFWEYVRILKENEPKYFILENVNSMPKESKALITETLGVEPIMINAALVSAQNRKRLFWIGERVDTRQIGHWNSGGYEKVNVAQPEDRGILLKDILEQDVDEKYFVHSDNWRVKRNTVDVEGKSRCLNASNFKGALNDGMSLVPIHKQGEEKLKSNTVRSSGRGSGIDDKHNWDTIRIGQIGKGGQGDRIYSPEGKSVGLSALGGGRGAKTGLYAVPVALRNRGEGKKPEYNGTDKANSMTTVQTDSMVAFIIDTRQMSREGVPRIYDKGKSPTLNSTMYKEPYSVTDNTQIRKLTPIECERLQGLEDNYTEGVSNSQRYKMLGNAFNVDVVSHILSFIEKPVTKKDI